MPARGTKNTVPVTETSLANLKAGDLQGFDRDEKGRITTSRSEIGRQHALDILSDPRYRERLKDRMIAGEGGAIEVWIWRIGYGDPPRPKDDDTDDQARFDRIRGRLRTLMQNHPEELRAAAELVAREGPKLLPSLLKEPDADRDPPPNG